jgi:hypothetical protein
MLADESGVRGGPISNAGVNVPGAALSGRADERFHQELRICYVSFFRTRWATA